MKGVTIFCILLVSLPALAGTWRDDFEDGDLAGYEEICWNSCGNWEVIRREARLTIGDNATSHLVLNGVLAENVVVEFDAMIEKPLGKTYGLDVAIRELDSHNAVLLNLAHWHNRGTRVGAYLNLKGQWLNWQEIPHPFEVKRWYHLKGVAKRGEFTLFVDGNRVLTFQENRLAQGKVGFGAGGKGCIARFDNLIIIGEGIPDIGPSGYMGVEFASKLATTWGQLKAY